MSDKKIQAFNFYEWKGINSQGVNTKGLIRSDSVEHANSDLLAQNVNVLQIKLKPSLLIPAKAQKKIKSEDINVFFRQLATMISAGIPLVQSLEFVAKGVESIKMYSLIMTLHKSVSAGNTLADSMRNFSKYFSELVCSLIKIGEESGTLETVLGRVADYLERIALLKSRVKKAMFYPVIMFCVMVVLAVLLLTFIVPKFEGMFKSFGKELPAPTQFVINASAFLQDYWWVILSTLFIIIAIYIILKKRSEAFRYFIANVSLHLPIFGELVRKTAIARIVRTLSMTLSAGLPIIEALNCVARVAGNLIYSDAIYKIRDSVSMGDEIAVAMQESGLFPAMVVQMVGVGEKAGELESMMKKIADFYDEQIDNTVDGLSTLIEPIMIILLGLIIGGFVVSMYLPIFKIGTLV